jgi:hypothetical protein
MRSKNVLTFVTWFIVAAPIPRIIVHIVPPSGTPPTITSLTAGPDVLWPPNHKMVRVSLQVTATGDPSPDCRIDSTASNEPGTEDQWVVTGPLTVNLRAERTGSGNGRVYTIRVTCTNTSGIAAQTVRVGVPHDH